MKHLSLKQTYPIPNVVSLQYQMSKSNINTGSPMIFAPLCFLSFSRVLEHIKRNFWPSGGYFNHKLPMALPFDLCLWTMSFALLQEFIWGFNVNNWVKEHFSLSSVIYPMKDCYCFNDQTQKLIDSIHWRLMLIMRCGLVLGMASVLIFSEIDSVIFSFRIN